MVACTTTIVIQGLAVLWVFLTSTATVTSQQTSSECIQWYSPLNASFAAVYNFPTSWELADTQCGRTHFGFNILQRGYRNPMVVETCATNTDLIPLRLMKNISNLYYWVNRDGLDTEILNATELSDMDPVPPAGNAVYGALNFTTLQWTLVESSHQFDDCIICEILKRKDLRTPVRNNPATNGVTYMWRYDVVVAVVDGTSNDIAREDLADVLKVQVENIVEIMDYLPTPSDTPTFLTTPLTSSTPTTTTPTTTSPTTTRPTTTTFSTTPLTSTTPTTTTPTTTTPTTTSPTTTTPTTTPPTTVSPVLDEDEIGSRVKRQVTGSTDSTLADSTPIATDENITDTTPIAESTTTIELTTLDPTTENSDPPTTEEPTTTTTDPTTTTTNPTTENSDPPTTKEPTTTTTDPITTTTDPTTTTPDPITRTPDPTTEYTTTYESTTDDIYNTTTPDPTTEYPTTYNTTTTATTTEAPIQYHYLFYRVTLLGSHSALPPVSAVNSTERIQVMSIDNVGVCPAQVYCGHSWPATRPAHVVVKRNPGTPSVLLARECVIDGLLTTNNDSARASWTEPSRWFEVWAPCDSTITGETDEEVLDNIGDILNNLTETPVLSRQLDQIADLVNQVLQLDEEILGKNGNTTRRIIQDLEIILTNMILEDGIEFVQSVRTNVYFVVSNVFPSNPVVGLSITKSEKEQTTNLTIYKSDDEYPALSDEFEVVTILPTQLVSQHTRLAFTVFPSSAAFVQNTHNVNSFVLSIILTDDDANTTFPDGEFIDIIFHPSVQSEVKECAYWDFFNSSWSTEGCFLLNSTNSPLDICRCTHLTNFAEIITGGNVISPADRQALDIISLVGCTLSIIALSLIALTGLCFKQWRQELSNKIILHMSAAVALNLIAFILVATVQAEKNGGVCIFLGVLLHYSVLACMFWMLVMSGLQMLRLTTMLGYKIISRLQLKASLFAWGVPFIPVIVLLSIDHSLYTQTDDRTFCYPDGLPFFLTVLLPITLTMLTNAIVFLIIFMRLNSWLCWSEEVKLKRHGLADRTISLRRLRTLLFLFVLFGLTWVFGLFAADLVFAYLFCITATMQGVLLFVFLVLIERKTYGTWKTAVSEKLSTIGRSSGESQVTILSSYKTFSESNSPKSM